jgi:hypothetical protein
LLKREKIRPENIGHPFIKPAQISLTPEVYPIVFRITNSEFNLRRNTPFAAKKRAEKG